LTTGGRLSRTVIVKLQEAVFKDLSVAVHRTVVVPTGKAEPEGGTQTTVAPEQLSDTVGEEYETTATHWAGAQFTF
jgi:hypothetical protein